MKYTPIALGMCLLAAALSAQAQTATRKNYIIQLADAPAVNYTGTVSGLKATKPAAGTRFSFTAADVQSYVRYLDQKASAVKATVPAAQIYQTYNVAFNGFAAKLSDAELQKLAANPGVAAITADDARSVDTNYTPSFLGLNKAGGAWSKVDANGKVLKGENVIIAHIDGGVWPENPSFSDKVDAVTGKPIASHLPGKLVYDPLPSGRYRGICQTGPGFSTTHCNNKLVGAQVFNAGWIASGTAASAQEFVNSPRDGDGHGTHTLSTAGGNENVDVVVNGTTINGISGMAPRARVAAYKVCYQKASDGLGSCITADSLKAIDAAVSDGADVINYSISGAQTTVHDAVEVAFFNAAAAGVFVSASAGNSGPANTVAHNSPWLTTVGNSTHDRFTAATVTLGNGVTATGPSFQTAGVPSKPIILAANAGVKAWSLLSAADKLALARCYTAADRTANGGSADAALDPAKVAGKIVVCYRGTNVLINKVQAVKDAGGAAAIIQNLPAGLVSGFAATADTTLNISFVLPTVHLAASNAAAVVNYAGGTTASPTAMFSGAVQVPGVVAPVMNSSSSRGPNLADSNILKPDITAPGTDIIAAYTASGSLTAAEHAQVAAGTLIPGPGADSLTGTSMSSPHIAGIAALLKQEHPTWSPWAIKSALMTSAAQSVKLDSGAADTNRWGYGAGHVNPTAAVATNLVYDTTVGDYANYFYGYITPYQLNLASMTRSDLVGVGSLTRTLTNMGSSAVTYNATANLPGFDVTVSPSTLTIPAGGSASFTVSMTRTTQTMGTWSFGDVTWTGDGGKTVRSPLSAKPTSLVANTLVEDTRTSGTRVFTVGTGYTGALLTTPTGMVASTRNMVRVNKGDFPCFPITVPTGAKRLRAQMFNSETEGGVASDLDLYIYKGNTQVGGSGSGTSDELVMLSEPAAGSYQVCIDGYAPANGSALATLHTWVVGPATGTQTLKSAGASTVKLGGTASVAASWGPLPIGERYIGAIDYRSTAGGALLGSTTVYVDTNISIGTTAAAPVIRMKPAN